MMGASDSANVCVSRSDGSHSVRRLGICHGVDLVAAAVAF